MKNQVIIEVVQRADYFACIFSYSLYIGIPLEFGCEFKVQYNLKARCLLKGSSVHHDWRQFRLRSAMMEFNQFSFRGIEWDQLVFLFFPTAKLVLNPITDRQDFYRCAGISLYHGYSQLDYLCKAERWLAWTYRKYLHIALSRTLLQQLWAVLK